jgi:hypothetical protein
MRDAVLQRAAGPQIFEGFLRSSAR